MDTISTNVATPILKLQKSTYINANIILRQGEKILLLLRKNTGYCDGLYGLVAGHVEDGESATQGIVREAFEEAGLILEPKDLRVVHIAHRKSDRNNIDIYFECFTWQGQIINKEPHKCEALEFFSFDALPSNIIPGIKDTLEHISKGKFYSEKGWE